MKLSLDELLWVILLVLAIGALILRTLHLL
jgi:hypothetical protein